MSGETLKRLSHIRCHHLLKTFWGWRDVQLTDGTVIWTLPSGQVYVTSPGSAILFPALSEPTDDAPVDPRRGEVRCGERTALMPRRQRTRTQQRSQRITIERNRNRRERENRRHAVQRAGSSADDPPF